MKEVDKIHTSGTFDLTHNTYWSDNLIAPTESVINNFGHLRINASNWQRLNKLHHPRAIKRLLSRAIVDHKVPLPLQTITREQMISSFKVLKRTDSRKRLVAGPVFSRFDYRWRLDNYFIDVSNTCNPASNYFHQYNRWLAGSAKMASPYEAWTEFKHHNTFLNNMWSMKRPKVTKGILNSAVNLKFYVASQFKPQAAKVFYDMFNAQHVLDLSSGWGDRLCGFCAGSTTKSYVGIDPNTRLIAGYQAQKETYGHGKSIEMVSTGSELYDPKGKKFDTIFTSPPYFAVEHYSNDEGQSFNQYSTFDAWCDHFFYPTLDMAWDALDTSQKGRGGVLCINISDIIIKNQHHNVCDRLNDYLSKKKGSNYIGCIGLRLSLRPNITKGKESESKEGAFIEPMWLWSKGGTWTLEDYIKHGFKKPEVKGLFK